MMRAAQMCAEEWQVQVQNPGEARERIRTQLSAQAHSFVRATALLRLDVYHCVLPFCISLVKIEHECLSGGPGGKVMPSRSSKHGFVVSMLKLAEYLPQP